MPSTKPTADFEYTDAELLALWREALAVISIRGHYYQIGNRMLTSHNLREIREMVTYYQKRVEGESSGMTINLARMK